MAGTRFPGPEDCLGKVHYINDGTLMRRRSECPGVIGVITTEDIGHAEKVSAELDWVQIKADMKTHENCITHMYLDTEGNVTVGIGNKLPSLMDAQRLGFVLRNDHAKVATKAQIEVDWKAVTAEENHNHRAAFFFKLTLLDLPDPICWGLLQNRINSEFLPGLKKQFSEWEKFPKPAKRALLDMAYNLGLKGLKKFKVMCGHVILADWGKAAETCTRNGVPDERNDWTKARFREAISK